MNKFHVQWELYGTLFFTHDRGYLTDVKITAFLQAVISYLTDSVEFSIRNVHARDAKLVRFKEVD